MGRKIYGALGSRLLHHMLRHRSLNFGIRVRRCRGAYTAPFRSLWRKKHLLIELDEFAYGRSGTIRTSGPGLPKAVPRPP